MGLPRLERPIVQPVYQWKIGRQKSPKQFPSLGGVRRAGNQGRLERFQRTRQEAFAHISKVRKVEGSARRSWAGHGVYLQRKGGQREDAHGVGFSAERDEENLHQLLKGWNQEDDIYYRGYISIPEGDQIDDLKEYTRAVMGQVEKEVERPLVWGAIDHHNTEIPHIHVVIRGRDRRGNTLELGPRLLSLAIGHAAREEATNQLGWRTIRQDLDHRETLINKEGWTVLDEDVEKQRTGKFVTLAPSMSESLVDQKYARQLTERMEYLETQKLATRRAAHVWEIKDDAGKILRHMNYLTKMDVAVRRHGHAIRETGNRWLREFHKLPEHEVTGTVLAQETINPHNNRHYLLVQRERDIIETRYTGEPFAKGETVTMKRTGEGRSAEVLVQKVEYVQKQTVAKEEEQQQRTQTQAIRIDDSEQQQRTRTRRR